MRDILVWVAETLFYLQGGEALIMTPWILVWVIAGCVVIAGPMLYVLFNRISSAWSLLTLVWFVFGLFVVISPGAIQQQLMTECKPYTATIKEQEIAMQECRFKSNYYGEFDEWRIVK